MQPASLQPTSLRHEGSGMLFHCALSHSCRLAVLAPFQGDTTMYYQASGKLCCIFTSLNSADDAWKGSAGLSSMHGVSAWLHHISSPLRSICLPPLALLWWHQWHTCTCLDLAGNMSPKAQRRGGCCYSCCGTCLRAVCCTVWTVVCLAVVIFLLCFFLIPRTPRQDDLALVKLPAAVPSGELL